MWGVGQSGLCRVMLASESGSSLLRVSLCFWSAGQLHCALRQERWLRCKAFLARASWVRGFPRLGASPPLVLRMR